MTTKTAASPNGTTWAATMKRLDALKPAIATFTICDDPDLRAELAQARQDVERADATLAGLTDEDEPNRHLFEHRAKQAHTALSRAQKAFDRAAVVLRFRAIPRQELVALQRAHPPTEQEEADGEEYAMETFAPALLAAASLDGMPADYARQCLDTWPAADAQALWRAAWGIQHQGRADLGKG